MALSLYITVVPTESQVAAAGVLADVSERISGQPLTRKSAFNAIRFLTPPLLVGTTSDDDLLRATQEALEGAGFTTATLEAGESPEALRMDEVAPAESDEAEPEPDFEVNAVVAQTALAFMAFGDGAASAAVSYLATMDHIDPDGPYRPAVELLLQTFPPHAQQVAVAQMIVDSADDESDI